MKKMLNEALLFLRWYLTTGVTILTVTTSWLLILGNLWSMDMLGNVLLALALAIAFLCEGLRRRRGTHDPLAFLIFPVTVVIFVLDSLLLRIPNSGAIYSALLLAAYGVSAGLLLSGRRYPKAYRHTPRVTRPMNPRTDLELKRAAAQFTSA